MADDSDFELAKIRFRKLHKKAKELNIDDKDILKLDFVLKHKPKDFNLIAFGFKIILYTILSLVTVSALLYLSIKYNVIDGKKVAKFSTIWTGIDLTNDQCIIPFTELFLDAFRPPVDCNFCKNVTSFTRVNNLSQNDFIRKYAYSGTPVIITDAQRNWTAKDHFSFNYFKGLYKKGSPVLDQSQKECQFFPYRTSYVNLDDVFKMPKSKRDMRGDPWYIGWNNCDPEAANLLRQHYEKPYFLSPEMESSRTDWIFMGTPGYGAHLHIDQIQHSSWQAQINGDKEWILEAPPECYYECPGRFSTVVREGEIIVLDTNKWFHQTNVVGEKMSIVIGSEYD